MDGHLSPGGWDHVRGAPWNQTPMKGSDLAWVNTGGKDEELGFGPNMEQEESFGPPWDEVRPYKVPHGF